MSPDSPQPSGQRKRWRFVSSLALVLAAFSLFASVWLNQRIQTSRVDSIRQQCAEQNARHDGTVRTLDELIAKAKRSGDPARARRAESGRASTLLFINALAPHRDCDAWAKQLTD